MAKNTRIRMVLASLALIVLAGCAGEEGFEAADGEDTGTTEQATIATDFRVQELTARKLDIEFQYEVLRLRLTKLNAQLSQLSHTCPDTPEQCEVQLTLLAREAKQLELQLKTLEVQHAEVVAELEALKKSVDRSIDREFRYAS